jgi:hypothetical protein
MIPQRDPKTIKIEKQAGDKDWQFELQKANKRLAEIKQELKECNENYEYQKAFT